MDIEVLIKANRIKEELDKYKRNFDDVSYMNSKNVVKRDSILKFNGIQNREGIFIPEDWFKDLASYLMEKYTEKIHSLENELEKL